MSRLLAILLVVACAGAAEVKLTWEPAEDPNSVIGYMVLVATNNGAWKTNALRPPMDRNWTNKLAAGTWKLGVQTLRRGGTNSTHVWSCGFRVPPEVSAAPPVVTPITFTGTVSASLMVNPNGTNVIFWLRPSSLNRSPGP